MQIGYHLNNSNNFEHTKSCFAFLSFFAFAHSALLLFSMCCESNDNLSKTVSTVSRLYANPIFLPIKWPYGITCGFFHSFLLRSVSCLVFSRSPSIFVCCRFLDSLVFVVASVFDRHTHAHSLSHTHIHSFIHSLTHVVVVVLIRFVLVLLKHSRPY